MEFMEQMNGKNEEICKIKKFAEKHGILDYEFDEGYPYFGLNTLIDVQQRWNQINESVANWFERGNYGWHRHKDAAI
jgi:hypothetical protein